MPKSVAIADTTRINLVREIGNIFRRGVRDANIGSLDFSGLPDSGTAATVAQPTPFHAEIHSISSRKDS
ncbi:hypothetical protein E7747_16225 (plasmid) [Duncaniella dubosii]|uniref:Uncharacterized protein n=1 Tax=Duncaniella dubosii TaxID=2518971 RepID=A0A4V1D3Q2_9BACT|nr:hypothetical protein [Duncaniella dubosii]QCD43798.1 hypothetical protein E7747_16225 [Duncaniella dubosii]